MKILADWLHNAIALYLVSLLIPGVQVQNFVSAMVAVVVLGLLNALLKPVLVILTLPITLLTLGLFTFILNALLFLFAGNLLQGFSVDGFGSAFLGSLLFTIFRTILNSLTRDNK